MFAGSGNEPILAGQGLSLKVESVSDRELKFKVTTHNLSRLDVYLDWRPQQTLNIEDGTRQLRIKPSSPDAAELRLLGYDGEKLAAVFRQTFS